MKGQPIVKHVKVITLGPSLSGKTCVIMKATNPEFICPWEVKCTIGVDFKIKECLYANRTLVKMHLWDTAGQDRFQQLNRMYYHDVNAALFIFDLENRESFGLIDFYWKDFEEFSEAKKPVVKLLVGNKCDSERRRVSRTEGEAWAQAHSVPYFETSAKTGEHIPELFDFLLETLMTQTLMNSTSIVLQSSSMKKTKKRRFC